MKSTFEFQQRFADFCRELKPHLDKLMDEWHERGKFQHAKKSDIYLDVREGSRYIRIFREGSCYAFIDKKDGAIYKPATYKAPAKHSRGNIFEEDYGLHCCELFSVQYLR